MSDKSIRMMMGGIEPVGKQRPFFSGKTRAVFTPATTKNFEKEVQRILKNNLGDRHPYPRFDKDIPLILDIDFACSRPKSKEKKKFLNWFLWKMSTPDIDNLCKGFMDAANKILWADDRQIVGIRARKFFACKGSPPQISFFLRPAPLQTPMHLCDHDYLESENMWVHSNKEDPSSEDYDVGYFPGM